MTLENDHSMGMTVVGTVENMQRFNFVTSAMISSIEYVIMNGASEDPAEQSYSTNGVFSSVMLDMVYDYLFNKMSIETFDQMGL